MIDDGMSRANIRTDRYTLSEDLSFRHPNSATARRHRFIWELGPLPFPRPQLRTGGRNPHRVYPAQATEIANWRKRDGKQTTRNFQPTRSRCGSCRLARALVTDAIP